MTTSEEYERADPAPDADAQALIAALQPDQIQAIDAAVLSAADCNWRKLAFIVGSAMGSIPGRVSGIPDVYYAQRIAALESQGRLESRGDLSRMRYCEIRIPRQVGEA